jgi:hypothetical protein
MNDLTFVVRELRYVLWAYNLIWLLLAAYMTFLLVKLGRLRKELRRLSAAGEGSERD